MASSSSSSPLEDLETQLEMFVENVRQIRIIVADFQPQGQTVLNQKIQNAVTGLQEINKLKSNVQDIHVPLEVFEYIDRGRNPQLYTKDCIEKALHKNEQVKGKIDAFKKFKANVLTDLGQTFPNELNKYRALRSNCYGTNNVVPPPPPPMNILSSGTPLSGSNNSQQSQLVGSCLSVQQINNASTVVSGASSCLSNSQQQPNATNISLLGCDAVSTVSVGNNSNNIGGPPEASEEEEEGESEQIIAKFKDIPGNKSEKKKMQEMAKQRAMEPCVHLNFVPNGQYFSKMELDKFTLPKIKNTTNNTYVQEPILEKKIIIESIDSIRARQLSHHAIKLYSLENK